MGCFAQAANLQRCRSQLHNPSAHVDSRSKRAARALGLRQRAVIEKGFIGRPKSLVKGVCMGILGGGRSDKQIGLLRRLKEASSKQLVEFCEGKGISVAGMLPGRT